jgi:hypothetical protein
MRESLWLYPLAGVLHVIAIGLLLGSIVAFDVRVLGVAGTVPLRDAAHRLRRGLDARLDPCGLGRAADREFPTAPPAGLVRPPRGLPDRRAARP